MRGDNHSNDNCTET